MPAARPWLDAALPIPARVAALLPQLSLDEKLHQLQRAAYVNATLLGVKPDTATPPLFSLQDPVSWRILMTVWYYEKSPQNTTGYYQELDKCTMGPSWCGFNMPWCDHT